MPAVLTPNTNPQFSWTNIGDDDQASDRVIVLPVKDTPYLAIIGQMLGLATQYRDSESFIDSTAVNDILVQLFRMMEADPMTITTSAIETAAWGIDVTETTPGNFNLALEVPANIQHLFDTAIIDAIECVLDSTVSSVSVTTTTESSPGGKSKVKITLPTVAGGEPPSITAGTITTGSGFALSVANPTANAYVINLQVPSAFVSAAAIGTGAVGSTPEVTIVSNELEITIPDILVKSIAVANVPGSTSGDVSVSDGLMTVSFPDPCGCGGPATPPVTGVTDQQLCNACFMVCNAIMTDAVTAINSLDSSAGASDTIVTAISTISGLLTDVDITTPFSLAIQFFSTFNTEVTNAIKTDVIANQTTYRNLLICLLKCQTANTGNTLTNITLGYLAAALQSDSSDTTGAVEFIANFIRSLGETKVQTLFFAGLTNGSTLFDCSTCLDCTQYLNCTFVSSLGVQPGYYPTFNGSYRPRYDSLNVTWWFDSASVPTSALLAIRYDTLSLAGRIATSTNPVVVYFQAGNIVAVKQGDTDSGSPLSDTLAANGAGEYVVTNRYVEIQGNSASTEGAAFNLTQVCQRAPLPSDRPSVAITYLYGTGPASVNYGDTLTVTGPADGGCSGLYYHNTWFTFAVPVKATLSSVGGWTTSGCSPSNTTFCYSRTTYSTTGHPQGCDVVNLAGSPDPTGTILDPVIEIYLNPIDSDGGAQTISILVEQA
jgi:hypothetical protein